MDRAHNRARLLYQIPLCVYTIVLPVFAQEKPVTNIAGPSASSSGSVINQGVQVLNGPYMSQSFGSGVVCQGASLSISPFVNTFVNQPWDPESYGSHSLSPGIAATFSVPLDNEAVALCKERAKAETNRQIAETAKAKLDFELVRLLKCGEAKKSGIDFHPQSPYYAVCADVVVNRK